MLLRSFFLAVVLIIPLLLQACGFEPLYAHQTTSNQPPLLTTVDVAPISGEYGQIFKTKLENALNPAHISTSPKYRLVPVLDIKVSSLAIERDRTVTRYQVVTKVSYTLMDTTTNTVVRKGTMKRENGYDRTTSEYATFVSSTESVENALKVLAKDLSQQVASTVIHHNQP